MHNGVGLSELMGWHEGYEPRPGDIVTTEGRVLGQHKGSELYTVGQRRGLSLGGGTEGLAVLRIDTASNRVVVADRESHPVRELVLSDFVDMAPGQWQSGETLDVRVRYRQREWPARIESAAGSVRVIPQGAQFSIAEGQWCVGYRGDTVLFGGIIAAARTDLD
jgi:tRNA-specific 2-thiouridylase